MKQWRSRVRDLLITVIIMGISFGLCMSIQYFFKTEALIPAIFILGAFLVSVLTQGYLFGIISALIGVLLVNFAFTFPIYHLDFNMPENIVSAIIMIFVSTMTCTLTTKLKRQEALKTEGERERMRANLLRAVSHDLRTPLTTIYGSSSAMLDNYHEFSDEQKIKMLNGIQEDAQWLIHMVENLLSITRLDDGNVKIIKTETMLDELIDVVLVKFAKRYPDQEVQVDIPEDFVMIPMDAILIEQVLVNILENAVQHAKGMTELSLKVFVIDKKAVFEIADNGEGIPEDRLKNLFTGCFYSDDVVPDGHKKNAGIGLSVCATIIKAHGGDITAVNLKSGGAVFRFTLNLEDSQDEQQV